MIRGQVTHLGPQGLALGPGPAWGESRLCLLLLGKSFKAPDPRLSFIPCRMGVITGRFHKKDVRKEASLASSQCLSAVITVMKAECGPGSGEPSPTAPPRVLKESSRDCHTAGETRTTASGSTGIATGFLLSLLN